MSSLHALFEHELKDIYDAETKLVDALRNQARDTKDPEIKQALESHQRETQEHRKRVEKVFDTISRQPSQGKGCAGVEGLLDEYKAFRDENPASEVHDVYTMGACLKVERYEITAYEGLIRLAKQLGNEQAATLLQQNLQEEKAAADKLTRLSQDVERLKRIPAQPS